VAEYFPGSSRPIAPAPGPRDLLAGAEGKTFTIGGKPVELFTISQVAELLNRKPVTLRKWEERGVVPRATFAKPGANGDKRGRRRLYSRAQVEALVRIAEEEKILLDPHAHIGKTHFQAKVWAAFKEIANR
jgi:hypothetical protein